MLLYKIAASPESFVRDNFPGSFLLSYGSILRMKSPGSIIDLNKQPPQKRMRKGTRSCVGCRRKKVRCTYEPNRPSLCNECFARGEKCVDQKEFIGSQPDLNDGKQYSLRERVTYLETAVQDIFRQLGDGTGFGEVEGGKANKLLKAPSINTVSGPPESFDTGPHGSAPVLTLFDNAVLERKEDTDTENSGPKESIFNRTKDSRIRKSLSVLLPSQKDVEAIFHGSQIWRKSWRWMCPESYTSPGATIEQFTVRAYESRDPMIVAKLLLCIVISLEQLPNDFSNSYLSISLPVDQLIEKYVSTVSSLITSNNDIADTIEGIECMLLETKHYLNVGRPLKAWYIYRRALSFAEHLGIHRVLPTVSEQTNKGYKRNYNLWCCLVEGERYTSLILGLPYSVGDNLISPHIPKSLEESSLPPGEFYSLSLALLSSRIIDRNQDHTQMTLSTTLRLDEELRALKDSMPLNTWNIDMNPREDQASYFDRLAAQFFHHQIRSLIHLPLMLKSGCDQRYLYSKTAAIESSRDMLICYQALRSGSPVGPFMCKVVDFQSFTAAMLLLLSLLGYSRDSAGKASEAEAKDWGLVNKTTELLHRASREPGGTIAAQSARALELIASLHNGCDRRDGFASTKTAKICIPYFGTISIGVGKNFARPQTPTGESQSAKPGNSQLENSYPSSAATPTACFTSSSTTYIPQSTSSTIYSVSPNISGPISAVFGTEESFISFDPLWSMPPSIPDYSYNFNSSSSHYVQDAINTGSTWSNKTIGLERRELDQDWNWIGFESEVEISQL
ncbi:hypothetical protein B7463_g3502, partial [Scytalidium lignicola]